MTITKFDEVERLLKNHEERLALLEGKPAKKNSHHAAKGNLRLPDHILALRDNGFFSSPKTADEVHKKLQGTYHCESDRVTVALLRLANRKLLRKATKSTAEKKYKAYVW